MRPYLTSLPLLLLVLSGTPCPASSQSLMDLLGAVRQGGGWVTIPIEQGRGEVLTRAVPTGGLALGGCVQVWGGHSGRWDIRAVDTYSDRRLEARVASGEPIPFSYASGAWSRLDVRVRWSEPRDTTLLLWVGLARPGGSGRDPCQPVYGGGGERSVSQPAPPSLRTLRRSPTSGSPLRFPRASR